MSFPVSPRVTSLRTIRPCSAADRRQFRDRLIRSFANAKVHRLRRLSTLLFSLFPLEVFLSRRLSFFTPFVVDRSFPSEETSHRNRANNVPLKKNYKNYNRCQTLTPRNPLKTSHFHSDRRQKPAHPVIHAHQPMAHFHSKRHPPEFYALPAAYFFPLKWSPVD